MADDGESPFIPPRLADAYFFLRLLAVLASFVLFWNWLGAIGIVLASPLAGVFLSRELLAWFGAARRGLRAHALRGLSGRHYAYKGVSLEIRDDDHVARRWICVADLAQALGDPIGVATLRRRHGAGLREFDRELFISDEAAMAYLGERLTSDRALRLRQWIEREVWYPVRHRR